MLLLWPLSHEYHKIKTIYAYSILDMAKETYRLNGIEITSLINEEVERALSENQTDEKWTYNDMFGVKTRRENRVNAIKYARLYGSYVNKIQKISDEVSRRLEILQNSQRLNEVAGALARIGAKFAAKGITKSACQKFSPVSAEVRISAAGCQVQSPPFARYLSLSGLIAS